MKNLTLWCPKCGAKLQVDVDVEQATCECCGTTFSTDEALRHRRSKADGRPDHERDEQSARQPDQPSNQHQQQQTKPKSHMALWILGWLFFFPAPLGVLIYRFLNKRGLNKSAATLLAVFIVTALCLVPSVLAAGLSSTRYTGGKGTEPEVVQERTPDRKVAPKEEDTPEGETTKGYIDLQKGVRGDYGQDVTVDVRFVGRVTDIAYHIPPGNYKVKNCGIYPVQLDAYNGTVTGTDGVSELGSLAGMSNLESGETRIAEVGDGWVLAITSNAGHVVLVPEGSDVSIDSIKVDDGVNVIDSCGRQLKEYCYGLVAATYPNEDVNWNMSTWSWKFNVWDTDGSIDVQINVPTADGKGYVHSVWIMLTPETDGKSMTGGICHFISFDYIGRYTGDPVPEEHVYDEKGQPYRDRLDAIVRDTLGMP